MPRLSEVDRHRALGLLQAGLTISEVSLRMNVNRTTIFRLRQRLHKTKTVSDRPRSGRPRCTTQRQDRNLVRNHMNNRFLSASASLRQKRGRNNQRISANTAVSHQHLVPCVMAARCHDYAALAMPYYPGGDLTRCGKLQPRRANRYMSQVARALEHLHRHHISHNDVKLENIFLDASDRACLGDFGLSMEVKDESRTAFAGLVGGTRTYWSPEKLQADTKARIDPFKADVYALGVTYWALVLGQDPEENTDYQEKLRAASHLELSPSQRSALESLLEPDPSQRPTASQAVKMLKLNR
ncbi:CAMK family protein kinase [Elysia marginata]|uniref:CAMK family protein kinase n=1 Tax=Elysia marginata TaxID=1093978 RepID=A0AAV4HRX5_9GAST|nr:CAMK family protein kinase [Elysia marginata]